MVGFVLVSHSRALAEATQRLIHAMSGEEVPVVVAAGTGEGHLELGTDAVEISEMITSLSGNDGIVVMMDMGSAVLSAEMALDLLDPDIRQKVRLCPWAFIEGSVVAGVVAKTGGGIDDILREASQALRQKTDHLSEEVTQETEPSSPPKEGDTVAGTFTILIPHGFHARPAAQLVQLASRFTSDIRLRDLTNGKGPVSIKSITGVMTLEVLYGHEVEVTATGPDAADAIQTIGHEIQAGLGDVPVQQADHIESSTMDTPEQDLPHKEIPIGVSAGIVIAPVYFPHQFSYVFPDVKIQNLEEEQEKLKTALQVTRNVLQRKADEVSEKVGKERGQIFEAQGTMLEDPALVERAMQLIREKQMAAGEAWWTAVCEVMEQYKQLKDPNLKQRVLDLQDIAQLVLVQFGIEEKDRMNIPDKGIILVDDLTPGQAASLNTDKVQGVICLDNGETSHSAILLRSRGIPAIVHARKYTQPLRELPEGSILAMDGSSGEIWIDPQGSLLKEIVAKRDQWIQQTEKEKQESLLPAVTTDGKQISILANVGDQEDVRLAVANHAEGIGLLRTEFMFLHRETAPTEQEQIDTLRELLEPMRGKPVIIRTLDAGGDKELSYLHMSKEENPFLGVRAIRLTLRNPDLFRQQLRAILQVGTGHDLRLMFPMISTLEELQQAKSALEQAHFSLQKEQKEHIWPVSTGMMMEVPSSAILAHKFAPEVDFMSIGTNDLIQYTLAADRTNPQLQVSRDRFDPSVLILIRHICESCQQAGKSVSVCGEAAANPLLAGYLIGAGVTSLSMNPSSIPQLKAWVRTQSYSELHLLETNKAT